MADNLSDDFWQSVASRFKDDRSMIFDAFNEPWTRDLVTWHPAIDPTNGHLSLPDGPGLGIDFDVEVALAHPYDPGAYLNIHEEGWEKRIGSRGRAATAGQAGSR